MQPGYVRYTADPSGAIEPPCDEGEWAIEAGL
jgi:hypothetical protein